MTLNTKALKGLQYGTELPTKYEISLALTECANPHLSG